MDASWGGEESQDLEAGVLAGRSFWEEKAGQNTARHLAPCRPRISSDMDEKKEQVDLVGQGSREVTTLGSAPLQLQTISDMYSPVEGGPQLIP